MPYKRNNEEKNLVIKLIAGNLTSDKALLWVHEMSKQLARVRHISSIFLGFDS